MSPQSPEEVHGAIMLSLLVSSSLFGIITVQLILYMDHYRDDKRTIKAVVTTSWLLEGLQVIFIGCSLYTAIPAPPHNPWAIIYVPWLITAREINGITISGLVQTFYTWRIYQLNPKTLVWVTLGSLILLKLGTALVITFWPYWIPMILRMDESVWVVMLWLATEATLDLVIVVFMTHSLIRERTGFSGTDTIIYRMVHYAVHTGLLTSSVCVASLISYGVTRWSAISVGLTLPPSGLYVTAMLANLHTRSSLRELSENNEMTSELSIFRERHQTPAALLDGDPALPFPTASPSNSAH